MHGYHWYVIMDTLSNKTMDELDPAIDEVIDIHNYYCS